MVSRFSFLMNVGFFFWSTFSHFLFLILILIYFLDLTDIINRFDLICSRLQLQ